jgi:hypothetical protein
MKTLVGVFLCVLVVCAGGAAQNVAVSQISGSVEDSSGAALAGASVKLTQTDTGFSREYKSEDSGLYTASNLPVGPYRLEVTAPGFRTYVQTGIVLQVNVNPKINIVMQVGDVTQQVEVEAAALMVETTSTGVGQLIDNTRVLELPLNGRQITDLVLLTPGATTNFSGGFSSNRGFPVVPISVGGGGPGSTVYVMDGGTHNDPATNMSMPVPFPDALQEFKIETSALPARYGQHASAAVNLVTKSGTNSFHGTAFEFVRNGMFNAQNVFATKKDSLKRNQFGGDIGGPVLKDRLFFFGGYQGTETRSDPAPSTIFVPTQTMMNGDFTAITSGACTNNKPITLKSSPALGINFVNNTISPALFDKTALNYMKFIPLSTDPCGSYQLSYPVPSSEKQVFGKVDYQMSAKNSLFGRYFWANYKLPFFYDGKNALTTPSVGVDNTVKSFVLGDTYSITNNLINAFRGTVIRSVNGRLPAPFVSPKDEGASVFTTDLAGAFTNLSVTNGFSLGGGGNNNAKYNYTVIQIADDVDMIKGAHQISFGVDFVHGMANIFNTQYSNGQFSFDGSVTGLGLADFLLGRVGQLQQGSDVHLNERSKYISIYGQDAWKFSSRVTITAGLRWEPYFPLTNAATPYQVFHFDPAAALAGTKSTVFANAPAGLSFPGDAGYPGNSMSNSHMRSFAPRLGVVYDPRGKGREVIRAAYGIFYDAPPMFYHVRVSSVPPWGALVTQNNISFTTPYSTYAGGNPFPLAVTKTVIFPSQGTYWDEPLNPAPLYTQQWNLTVEKQFATNWSVTVSYFGNKTTHLWAGIESNPAITSCAVLPAAICGASATTGTSNARRLFSLPPYTTGYDASSAGNASHPFGSVTLTNQGGNATYNAGLLSVQKRLSHNFSLQGNYTWSHCISSAEQQQFLDPVYSNPFDPSSDRGSCNADHRQIYNITAVMNSPEFKKGALEAIVGDWQFSPIFQYISGSPLACTTTGDPARDGQASGQRCNIVADPKLSNPIFSQWFNTSAFTLPTTGTFGNSGRNIFFGPKSVVVNMALSRKFYISSEMKRGFEFRTEAFNVFNRVNPGASQAVNGFSGVGNPVTVFGNANFGKVINAGDPRILQFALKFFF